MVISFGHDGAFNFLDSTGYVVTFRETRRKRPNCETWCNRGRGLSKEFDVRVSEIAHVDLTDETSLWSFARASGFDNERAWLLAIDNLNGGVPDGGWLYLVTKRTGNFKEEVARGAEGAQ